MNIFRLKTLFAVGLLMSLSQPATANIIIDSIYRVVTVGNTFSTASATNTNNGTLISVVGSDAVAQGGADDVFAPDFSATGVANTFGINDPFAKVFFELTFSLTQNYTFDLDWGLSVTSAPNGTASALAQLIAPDSSLILDRSINASNGGSDSDNSGVGLSGTLLAGNGYKMIAQAEVDGIGGFASFGNFRLKNMTAVGPPQGVPEPATITLLAMGLLGLGLHRRKKII